jgi:hypothetical protein
MSSRGNSGSAKQGWSGLTVSAVGTCGIQSRMPSFKKRHAKECSGKTGTRELRKITLYTFRCIRATVEFQATANKKPKPTRKDTKSEQTIEMQPACTKSRHISGETDRARLSMTEKQKSITRDYHPRNSTLESSLTSPQVLVHPKQWKSGRSLVWSRTSK